MKENFFKQLKEKRNGRALGAFFLVLSAFFFALMSVFVRLSGDLPTFQKAFFRNIIATIAAAAVLAKSKSFKMKKGSLPGLLLRSVTGAVGSLEPNRPLLYATAIQAIKSTHISPIPMGIRY